MRYTNLDESPAYVQAREALRVAELDLVDHQERVAALRRSLPTGPVVDDYELVEGAASLDDPDDVGHPVRLSQLFGGDERALIVYHLMFGKRQTSPCPMCTMWIDGFNGVARHVLGAGADLVVVAAAALPALRAHARGRGWRDLRVLSAGASRFKADLGSEDADGNQASKISVFVKASDGTVRHAYSGSPSLSDERQARGIDLLSATWGLLDLTPAGRGEFFAQLDYPA